MYYIYFFSSFFVCGIVGVEKANTISNGFRIKMIVCIAFSDTLYRLHASETDAMRKPFDM